MSKLIHPLDFPACQNFILDIQAMQGRAHRLGMIATAHALNKAMNDAGWELAARVEQERVHSSGERQSSK